ncbi:hypothetical protein KM043_011741 [Ampulex compressa]|nr:hypothetical protein KM043_011741 [Ampulex compressa]
MNDSGRRPFDTRALLIRSSFCGPRYARLVQSVESDGEEGEEEAGEERDEVVGCVHDEYEFPFPSTANRNREAANILGSSKGMAALGMIKEQLHGAFCTAHEAPLGPPDFS